MVGTGPLVNNVVSDKRVVDLMLTDCFVLWNVVLDMLEEPAIKVDNGEETKPRVKVVVPGVVNSTVLIADGSTVGMVLVIIRELLFEMMPDVCLDTCLEVIG